MRRISRTRPEMCDKRDLDGQSLVVIAFACDVKRAMMIISSRKGARALYTNLIDQIGKNPARNRVIQCGTRAPSRFQTPGRRSRLP